MGLRDDVAEVRSRNADQPNGHSRRRDKKKEHDQVFTFHDVVEDGTNFQERISNFTKTPENRKIKIVLILSLNWDECDNNDNSGSALNNFK